MSLIATRRYSCEPDFSSIGEAGLWRPAVSTASMVLMCALDLLGRSQPHLPRIEILDRQPAGVSATAAAFVDLRAGVIYLIASVPPFSVAQSAQSSPATCHAPDALKLVASLIVHEAWHLKHGADEKGAYYAQLMELQRLGLGPGRWAYANVQRAMKTVVDAQSKRGRTGRLVADAP